MNRAVILIAAVVLLVGSAYIQGVLTMRWGASADLVQASERLNRVPTQLGDWESKEVAMNPRALSITEATGYLNRSYTNRRTGQTIAVLILCGRPGPITVHSPQVCYGGIGYTLAKGWEFTVGADGGVLNASRFSKEGPSPDPIQVLQGWTLGDKLEYPEYPREVYANSRFLYKVYIVRHLDNLSEPETEDPARPFVDLFWPALHQALKTGS